MKVERKAGHGWKLASRQGWLFLSLGTELYRFHLALGRFSIAIERR